MWLKTDFVIYPQCDGQVGLGTLCGIRRKLSIGFRKRCLGTVGDHPKIGGCDNEQEGDSDNKAQKLVESALKQVFVDALNHDRDLRFTIARKFLFTKTFKQLITRPSPNALTKLALDLVNNECKCTYLNLAQCGQAFMRRTWTCITVQNALKKFEWLLKILLKYEVTKEAVEFMVHDSEDLMTTLHYIFNPFLVLYPDIIVGCLTILQQFVRTMCTIFVEVAQGQIFLTVDSRFALIHSLSWLMSKKIEKGSARWTLTKTTITELIGNLLLLDQAPFFLKICTLIMALN